jgi:hypothetical protein
MPEKQDDQPEEIKILPAQLVGEEYCYLTTTGRISGRPHEIEIWFGINENSLYLLSGGGERSDWVKNIRSPEPRAWCWIHRKRPGRVICWLQSIRAGARGAG